MEKQTLRQPTRSSFSVLRQLCNLIPADWVPQLARDTGVAEKSRSFTPWSQVVSLIYAQLTQWAHSFKALREKGRHAEVYLWPDLHDRYLITNLVGINSALKRWLNSRQKPDAFR